MLEIPQPILVVQLFPEILDELINLLKKLSTNDWTKPTICSDWSVKDVALHLLGIEIVNLSGRRDEFIGNKKIDNWEHLIDIVNKSNQDWVRTTNQISTRLLVDLLEFVGTQMCDYFSELDPYEIGGAISWAGKDPAPVWMDLAREYTERWHHQQHIRDAVGRSGLKQPKYFYPVIDTFIRALPKTYEEIEITEGKSVTVTIDGDSGGCWSIVRENSRWKLFIGAPSYPDTEIIIDQEMAWRLFTRGLNEQQMSQSVEMIGDKEIGRQIFNAVAIIA